MENNVQLAGSSIIALNKDSIEVVKTNIAIITELMSDVLKEGQHYGTIPGCGKKPALFKAGAEKLQQLFRLAPHYTIEQTRLDNYHKEFIVTCNLTTIETGLFVGDGVGMCTSMESKYRYRWEKQGNDKKKVDRDDIADVHNTVLKMAKKRALVDAILGVSGVSDIFTQDIEDIHENKKAFQEMDNVRKKLIRQIEGGVKKDYFTFDDVNETIKQMRLDKEIDDLDIDELTELISRLKDLYHKNNPVTEKEATQSDNENRIIELVKLIKIPEENQNELYELIGDDNAFLEKCQIIVKDWVFSSGVDIEVVNEIYMMMGVSGIVEFGHDDLIKLIENVKGKLPPA